MYTFSDMYVIYTIIQRAIYNIVYALIHNRSLERQAAEAEEGHATRTAPSKTKRTPSKPEPMLARSPQKEAEEAEAGEGWCIGAEACRQH